MEVCAVATTRPPSRSMPEERVRAAHAQAIAELQARHEARVGEMSLAHQKEIAGHREKFRKLKLQRM